MPPDPDPLDPLGPGDQAQPCSDWTTVEQVKACPPGTTLEDEVIAAQIPVASELLFNLNDKRYPGFCTATRSFCLPCVICARTACTCGPSSRFTLPGRYPVVSVTSVTIAGAVLDPSAYQLWDRKVLVRVDGNPWPRGLDLTQPDAFAVEWIYGRRIPRGAQRAAAKMAAEMAAACSGAACQLPSHVTQINREGVTYTIIDSLKMLEDGRTGVYEVDLWLAADREGRKTRPGGIDPAAPAIAIER